MIINKYIYVFFIGFIGKIYDDITELYLIKNDRLIECIKTFWTGMICYYLFNIASNPYDILWILFIWSFLPLVDWDAFTLDIYMNSLVYNITFIGIILLIVRKQIVNIKYFLIAFILYCICAPITEFFCFDFNGPLNNLFNKCKTNNLTKKEQEVSRKKLKTRIISVLFLTFMSILFFYLKNNSTDDEFKNVCSSVISISLCNNGYFCLSVINQIYVLYFNQKILCIHSKEDIKEEDIKEEDNKEDIKVK